MTIRKVGIVAQTPLGYFCLMPEDNVGTFVLTKHPESLAGEVKRAVQSMPFQGKALVVGAHIGTIAVPLSTHCSELVAIEPNPRAFEILELNANMNGRSNILLANVAANDKEEDLEFIVRYENSGGSGRMPVHKDEKFFENKYETIKVRGMPLDVVLADHKFDLVFMDCEGSEYFAFQGMPRILSEARSLVVEFMLDHITRVAGVTLEDFLRPLESNFNEMYIPTKGRYATKDFAAALADVTDDAGLIFRKR